MKKINLTILMTIILVLSISYSYGESLELMDKGLRAHPSGEPGKYEIYDVAPDKGQSTTTPATAHEYDVTGGSSGGNRCVVLKGAWENHKSNIASIKSTAKGKLKNLKKSFKRYYSKSKRAFKANYKKTILPRARKQQKSNAWIRKDYSRRWNRYKRLRKEKYYRARKAIIEHAKSEIKWRKEDMRKIKEEYGRKCKSKK